MAEQGPGSTNRTAKKRLARAKIKPTEHGIKSSKGRNNEAANEPSKVEQQKARKQKITAICVGIFAVIMALSMMLPSLTYIFGNNADQQAQQEQTQEQATSEETTDDAAEQEEAKTPGMDTVDANYAAVVNPLEAKLKDNPKDLATLLSLLVTIPCAYALSRKDFKLRRPLMLRPLRLSPMSSRKPPQPRRLSPSRSSASRRPLPTGQRPHSRR